MRSATEQAAPARPKSDVSSAVGLVGLAGLFAWVAFARGFPDLAEAFDWAVPHDTLGGRNSALFGLLRAGDPIPAYRLSAGSRLPGQPTLAARWRPALDSVLADLAERDLLVDLRSGSYAALGKVAGAVTVDVLAERADGTRTVVSHFNKAHKGRLARALASTRSEPADAAGVAAVARRADMRVERRGEHLTVIVAA